MAAQSYLRMDTAAPGTSRAPIFGGAMAKTNTRTCTSCAYSKEVPHGGDGKTTIAMCGLEPDPVSGAPTQLCKTQRLVGNVERSIAIRAAEMLGICGPLGTFWEPAAPVEAPVRWYQRKKA